MSSIQRDYAEGGGVSDDNVAAIVQIDYAEQSSAGKKIRLDTNSDEDTTCYAELLTVEGDPSDSITIKVSKKSKSGVRDTAIGDSSVMGVNERKTYYKPKNVKRGRKPLFVSNPGLFEEFKRNYENEQKLKEAQNALTRGLSNGKVLSKTKMTNEDEGITTVVVCQPLTQQTKESTDKRLHVPTVVRQAVVRQGKEQLLLY